VTAPAPEVPKRLPVRRGLYEPVVAQLTYRTLLGRRRALLLAIIPGLLLVLAGAIRRWGEVNGGNSVDLLDAFALTIVVPLIGLIAGTTAIGPEVDDGSIVYLMAKPLSRYTIGSTKFAVAAAVTSAFGAGATLLAGLILASGPSTGRVAVALSVAALLAGLAYVALFLALAIFTRVAVVVGLIYIVVWEGLVGRLVPGAQQLNIRQWSLAVAEKLLGSRAESVGVDSPVAFPAAAILLGVVIVGGVLLTGWRLQSARLTSDE
jgi:ABC-2 type transport system permease protein